MLLPTVTSFNTYAAVEYSHGFKKPSGDFAAVKSRSLSSETTLANVRADALVPLMQSTSPLMTISKFCANAETSGYPRPDSL